MAEVTSLFIVLIVIYASECVVWTRPNDWIFCGLGKGHWRVHCNPQFMIGEKGGLTIVGVIPPLPTYILIPSVEGSYKPDNSKPPGSRILSFDVKALTERSQEFRKESFIGRIIGNLLFIVIFIVLPAALWTGTIAVYWRLMLIVFIYLWVCGVSTFYIAHHQLFPDEKRQRLKKTLHIGVSPLSTIRAADQLARDLLRAFHPITVCYVLCSQVDFERYARMAYCDEVNAVSGNLSDKFLTIGRPSKSSTDCCIEGFLKSVGCFERLLAPPIPEDPSSRSYCPRCHCQYRAEFQICVDCGGIQLLPLNNY